MFVLYHVLKTTPSHSWSVIVLRKEFTIRLIVLKMHLQMKSKSISIHASNIFHRWKMVWAKSSEVVSYLNSAWNVWLLYWGWKWEFLLWESRPFVGLYNPNFFEVKLQVASSWGSSRHKFLKDLIQLLFPQQRLWKNNLHLAKVSNGSRETIFLEDGEWRNVLIRHDHSKTLFIIENLFWCKVFSLVPQSVSIITINPMKIQSMRQRKFSQPVLCD